MSVNLRTLTKYQVEYSEPNIIGYDECQAFVNWLYRQNRELETSIYISEDESEIEIQENDLIKLLSIPDCPYKKELEQMKEESDKSNEFIRLEIW